MVPVRLSLGLPPAMVALTPIVSVLHAMMIYKVVLSNPSAAGDEQREPELPHTRSLDYMTPSTRGTSVPLPAVLAVQLM